MKFCVFGFDKANPKVAKARKNLSKNPFSFEDSLKAYEEAISSYNYKAVYFIADFGYIEYVPFYRSISYNEFYLHPVPWIIIEKATITSACEDGVHKSNPMTNKLLLKMKGFTEKFDNPIKGFKRFDYYIKNKLKSDMYCDIYPKKKIYLTSSEKCIEEIRFGSTRYCKKYKIEEIR